MFRLLFGIVIGALIVYLADSRYLGDRRRMLKDRLSRTPAGEFTDRADEALQASRESIEDARRRASSTAEHAASRARETFDEARTEAQEWAAATHERVDSLTDTGPNR
jgi:F0F1-type ATP synthase membrane subunit b/b'